VTNQELLYSLEKLRFRVQTLERQVAVMKLSQDQVQDGRPVERFKTRRAIAEIAKERGWPKMEPMDDP